MKIEYPCMVVKYPGTKEKFQDGFYDWEVAANADELKALGERGFVIGTDVARQAHDDREAAKVAEATAAADKATKDAENKPPTREELEAKAKELGIHFDGRMGDKKLSELIADKLK